MYWEQVGNPRGAPVLFLHGGPGAGAGAVHRRFFDPSFWRIVIFDQRGAGRSRPLGGLEANTTGHLVRDIEALRRYLGIDRWLLFGGSWGSTLALAYAQAFPERVAGCVLRGVFLGRPSEVEWFLHGLAAVFPEAHAAFAGHLPEAERARPPRRLPPPPDRSRSGRAPAGGPRLVGVRRLVQHAAAEPGHGGELRAGPHRARAGAHRGPLLRQRPVPAARRVAGRHVPARALRAEIVQGRYDMICPARTAFELAAAWPTARLTVVPDAGHSALEPGIRRAWWPRSSGFRTCAEPQKRGASPQRRGGADRTFGASAALLCTWRAACRLVRRRPRDAGRSATRRSCMKVGVIGLGTMGMGAALSLVRAGHDSGGATCAPRRWRRLRPPAGTAVGRAADLPADLEALVAVRRQRRPGRGRAVRPGRLRRAARARHAWCSAASPWPRRSPARWRSASIARPPDAGCPGLRRQQAAAPAP